MIGDIEQVGGRDYLVVDVYGDGTVVSVPIPEGDTPLGYGRTWFRNDVHRGLIRAFYGTSDPTPPTKTP